MTWLRDISNEDYHRGEALREHFSSSNIKDFMRSPLHCRWNKDNPKDPTPAMRFGTIFHSLALEPDNLVVAPEVNLRTKAGKAQMEDFALANQGKVIATPTENAQASEMLEAVMNHRFARALMEAPGEVELTGTFKDSIYGINCKIRPDKINFDDQIIIDLKTTTDASEEAFSKAIYNFGYDISGTWYNLGGFAIEKKNYEFIIIAVEKEPPYGVNTFRLTEKHFEIAQSKIDAVLDSLARCIEKDNWPCYPQKIINPEVPAWESRKYWGHTINN